MTFSKFDYIYLWYPKKESKKDESEITKEEKQILQQCTIEQQQQEEESSQPPQQQIKGKRQISDAQRESLAKARELALLGKS